MLFGALSSTADERKGFSQLLTALNRLTLQADDVELLIVGATQPSEASEFSLPVHYLGTFNDELTMALVYSAADIFVAPSLQDNLPNTVMEAMACGTPCVAFNTGGFPDMIEHHHNGALAECFSAASLASEIAWTLEEATRSQLGEQARKSVEQKYSADAVVEQYLNLFESCVIDG
ncbi:glycosyltransferase [Oceanicoccus sp. KOV_DT_Chl]|uniref:glycosyltransferase n=1 Tax=Oceanicoccus sp. KOV_DT_Chl TaxID=1904639 RepID=UPI0013599EA8|nr:glycosyltransferase [Oceanicoccus sp. KOV_DT_Chl]